MAVKNIEYYAQIGCLLFGVTVIEPEHLGELPNLWTTILWNMSIVQAGENVVQYNKFIYRQER